ncbi:MAG: FAD-dependent oxidoreductase, partial [Desulfohalobiaceae bacterium]
VDQIIPAIGQRPDSSYLEEVDGLSFNRWGSLEADPVTFYTGRKGVFAGGDLHTGPWIAIGAVAAGREAAESIVRYLDGQDLAKGREPVQLKDEPSCRPIPENEAVKPRAQMGELETEQRTCTFNEVELGFEEEQGRQEAARCLNCGYCCECYQCVHNCLAGAVDHTQQPVQRELQIGSVVLCPGAEVFNPKVLEEFYHYREHKNVLTSLEFERVLSPSGPTMGHLVRPSDHKAPKNIAWIQCVGSRDLHRCGNGYCSSVCCMYAIKEAMVAMEHSEQELECTVFNMDLRTFGKDYELYLHRAQDMGVRFVNCRIHTIDPAHPGETDGPLSVRYVTESGELQEESFDLVVLSVGLQVSAATREQARALDLELNKYGFAQSSPFLPVHTSRPGVFACGTFQGPKDIPASVTEASAAAAAAGGILAPVRETQTKSPEVVQEMDVSNQEPRIGVFICNCGINIGGIVDVPQVQDYCKDLPGVVYCGQDLFTCSEDAQSRMKVTIQEEGINRVVVASCTPKTHEGIFMDTLEACGLNKYLFEMANIRNQDSLVHGASPEEATEKAKDLIRMAVARAAFLKALQEERIPVIPKALIVGGGVAGMNAALSLADQGFEAFLLEKEAQLGGTARRLTSTIEGEKIAPYVQELAQKVQKHQNVQVLTQAEVVSFQGFKGNFKTQVALESGKEQKTLEHGAVILATGGKEYQPKEYLYGEDSRVLTQIELGSRLEQEDSLQGVEQVVMIQCIGSRNEENPNCSRICCQSAVKNALHIKEKKPEARVCILYRDMRTYGLLEDYYTLAREKGVLFFRYTQEDPPQVQSTEKGLEVRFRDPILDRELQVDADLLALSAGVRAEDTESLSSVMKLARNAQGHFLEAHVKLRPVDMGAEGVYVCGTAHSPMLISEAVTQGLAVASRAATLLSKQYLTLSGVKARVDQDKCAACLICVRVCPYEVPRINEEGVSEIDKALCHGCGICAAECPAKAIELNWYEDLQITSEIDALLEEVL